ncbi:hypothetical protein [Sodalis sp. dw_96]|uniref:hypothetical protein n=1 Tax=Sodalis sp. dw_96 TaxID=2719794 RepID=UPI001BD5FC97|nr:hypothetical protein [Sodalis sp. dw_96]
MNAEIIKDFLAGLGFQQNADESLDTLGSTITLNITNLVRAADATVLSMGTFIGRLANGLDSFSTPPLGGAFSANAASTATGAATSLTGLASLTGTLAGLNRALQAPSFQATTVLTPLATALAPTLSLVQGSGLSDAANQIDTGSWGAVITKAGTSLSGLLNKVGARSPQSAGGSAAADRRPTGMSRTSRPLAGYSRYQVLFGGRNMALNTGNDNGMGDGVQTVRNGTSSPSWAEALGGNGTAMVRNNTSDVAGVIFHVGDKSVVVAKNALSTAADAEQTAAGFSAMRNSLINTVKGLVGTLRWPLPFGDSTKKTNGGSAKPANGSGAAGNDTSNADNNSTSSVTATDIEQNSALNALGSPPRPGNQPDSATQPAASGEGGIASLQTLLDGVGATLRRLTDFPHAGRDMSGGAKGNLNNSMSEDGRQATFNNSMAGDGGQSILHSAGTGDALGNLAKGFNVNPTALLNIAAPRLSASLTEGTGQWEPGGNPYANEPMGSAGAAAGATTLNQTTNITVNGAAAPSETANNIADRQISVNATLTQLLSPKAR